jgi:hypothetical protein
MEVLNSINWSLVKFDVLCIETDPPNRPVGYAEKVAAFMKSKGYLDHAGQVGRNMCTSLLIVVVCEFLILLPAVGLMVQTCGKFIHFCSYVENLLTHYLTVIQLSHTYR